MLVRPVLPGPLVFRHLLASAVITSQQPRVGDGFEGKDGEAGAELILFREYAQPFNFSRNDDDVTFTTPSHSAVQGLLVDGYADVVLQLTTGVRSTLSKLLFYTEDCPQVRLLLRA